MSQKYQSALKVIQTEAAKWLDVSQLKPEALAVLDIPNLASIFAMVKVAKYAEIEGKTEGAQTLILAEIQKRLEAACGFELP